MTEELLIRQVRQGDEEAYELIFRRYFKVLSVYAMSYLKDIEIAQDITQDVFVKLYESKESLQIHTSLKSFLYTTIRNRCLDYIKINRIHHDHKEIIKHQLAGTDVDKSDAVLKAELQEKIYEAINQLPEQRQKIFKLSRIDGKSNQEIATLLNLTKRTVETHISNALKNMKAALAEYLTLIVILVIKIFL